MHGVSDGFDQRRVAVTEVCGAEHADKVDEFPAVDILLRVSIRTVGNGDWKSEALTISVDPLPDTMNPGREPKAPTA